MRRRLLLFLSIVYLGFVILWGAASVAYQLHLIESPLLGHALLLTTGIFVVLGLLLYLWRGIHWLQSEWNARV
ncbi:MULTISPECIES: hypothetical protein [unclassified Haladaptatus]|uniref:hypothetical protein n=1 Tax=unclassified Haladaptatus TaxID=2622732 RepID=UPI00209C357A|nr:MULTISPECIES: hypothetical protein [unclassified Haladaptatus]MCO8244516.1 hypothetical protein [Haladaptatus sp. AB643]MCO8253862.1 hypothetical protein [Haladaptatus sp. AB618]